MLAKRGPAAERYKFLLWAYILPTVATRGDMSAALCAITVAHTCPHEVLQLSAINSPCGPTSCRQLPLGAIWAARYVRWLKPTLSHTGSCSRAPVDRWSGGEKRCRACTGALCWSNAVALTSGQ